MRALLCALLVAMMAPLPAPAQMLDFASLDGWEADDHRAALTSFLATCEKLADDWQPLCRLAADSNTKDASARAFFELFFRPVLIGAPPPELTDGQVYLDRAAIDSGALRGRGLELAWLDDPVEVFFLQVQGSGRIRMTDGRVIRVGYAGRNGHAYRSVGQEMVARGTHSADQVSAQEIRSYVRWNPVAGNDLLNVNPSYVFFRKIADLPADKGPIGAMGKSITALRSIAIDPDFTPLGAPVWIEKDGATPIRSLMVAQDTGGAIKGPQRADIFYGTGPAAGDAAGTIKDGGRMVVLLPIDRAFALLPEG